VEFGTGPTSLDDTISHVRRGHGRAGDCHKHSESHLSGKSQQTKGVGLAAKHELKHVESAVLLVLCILLLHIPAKASARMP